MCASVTAGAAWKTGVAVGGVPLGGPHGLGRGHLGGSHGVDACLPAQRGRSAENMKKKKLEREKVC